MKQKTLRISAALMALALLLILLPAAALAEEESGDALPEIQAKFSSNPNKRTALPLTLTEGDQLSINGVAIETVLGPKGNPLIGVGALATVAALSENADASGRVEIPVKKIGELAEEAALKDIQISSDGRYISYPARGATGGEEGLSDADFALLDAVRKGMNNPNYSWQDLLDYVKLVMDNGPTDAYNMMATHWGIPAETIKELMGDDNTETFLDAWIGDRNAAMQADMLGEFMKDRENIQAYLDINGQTFTLGVNGAAAATLAPTVWQDDLTPPTYRDPPAPSSPTVLVLDLDYENVVDNTSVILTQADVVDSGEAHIAVLVPCDVPPTADGDTAAKPLQEVTVYLPSEDGVTPVKGLLYQRAASGAFQADGTYDSSNARWVLVWANTPDDTDSSDPVLDLAAGFTDIAIYVDPPTDADGNIIVAAVPADAEPDTPPVDTPVAYQIHNTDGETGGGEAAGAERAPGVVGVSSAPLTIAAPAASPQSTDTTETNESTESTESTETTETTEGGTDEDAP